MSHGRLLSVTTACFRAENLTPQTTEIGTTTLQPALLHAEKPSFKLTIIVWTYVAIPFYASFNTRHYQLQGRSPPNILDSRMRGNDKKLNLP